MAFKYKYQLVDSVFETALSLIVSAGRASSAIVIYTGFDTVERIAMSHFARDMIKTCGESRSDGSLKWPKCIFAKDHLCYSNKLLPVPGSVEVHEMRTQIEDESYLKKASVLLLPHSENNHAKLEKLAKKLGFTPSKDVINVIKRDGDEGEWACFMIKDRQFEILKLA